MKEDEKIETVIVMKPLRNAQAQITGYDPVEVSKEMADVQIGKWESFEARQSNEKGNPSWAGVRVATDAEIKAYEKAQKKAERK